MIDRAEIERAAVLFRAPEGSFERLLRRRDRKRRNQRIGAGALAIIIALVSFVALTRAFSASTRPADEPVPKPPGIFSGVGGWIVYGDQDGIWAVDPTRPDDPNSQIQLSTETGAPLAWSSDGSKLLILRRNSEFLGDRSTSSSSTRTAPRHTWPRARGTSAGPLGPTATEGARSPPMGPRSSTRTSRPSTWSTRMAARRGCSEPPAAAGSISRG